MSTERETPETDAFEANQHPSCRFPAVLEMMRKLERERDEAREREEELREKYRMHHTEAERLIKIEQAARALITAKGRHNTQLAFDALRSEVEG